MEEVSVQAKKVQAPIPKHDLGFGRTLDYLKVDVDEAEGIDEEFNISGFPTFVFLKKGEKVANLIGNNVEKLRDLVNKHA